MGEFLVSFCLPVLILFGVGVVVGLALGVGDGCVSVANIELNFCRMFAGNLLLTGNFPTVGAGAQVYKVDLWEGVGVSDRLLLGVTASKGWGGGGGYSIGWDAGGGLGGICWLLMGVGIIVGRDGGDWLGSWLLLGVTASKA